MKFKNKILIGAAVAGFVLAAYAASTFVTQTGAGNATTPAAVIFPPVAGSQIRLVNVAYGSDTNNAVLSYSGGSTLFTIQETNQATSSITNKINSTNGLAGSSTLLLMHNGTGYVSTISTWNSSTNAGWYGGTNVVLASGGWGVATSAGDQVFLMDTPVTVPVGVGTNAVNGDAIYVTALTGRPLRLVVTPCLASNRIYSAVAKYE